MTIHATDPFATPEEERSPVRRLRGRMPATVTLWTAYGLDDQPAGLTVSSVLVADGEPGMILGLLDDESDLYAAVLASGRFAVTVLGDGDEQLADRFAGLLPAPGGLFREGGGSRWERTGYGPVRPRRQLREPEHRSEPASEERTAAPNGEPWVGCTVSWARQVGYAALVAGSVDQVQLGAADETLSPLVHHRGRYVRLAPVTEDRR